MVPKFLLAGYPKYKQQETSTELSVFPFGDVEERQAPGPLRGGQDGLPLHRRGRQAAQDRGLDTSHP